MTESFILDVIATQVFFAGEHDIQINENAAFPRTSGQAARASGQFIGTERLLAATISLLVKAVIRAGEAGCSVKADTLVSNDALANLFFLPGVTTVTWSADDGRGNLASAKQKVTVNVVALLELVFVAVLFFGILVGIYWLRRIKRRNWECANGCTKTQSVDYDAA